MIEGDVDAILIESMSDLAEVRAAVSGVRNVSDIPFLVTMSFDTPGRATIVVKPEKVAEEISGMDVGASGILCKWDCHN